MKIANAHVHAQTISRHVGRQGGTSASSDPSAAKTQASHHETVQRAAQIWPARAARIRFGIIWACAAQDGHKPRPARGVDRAARGVNWIRRRSGQEILRGEGTIIARARCPNPRGAAQSHDHTTSNDAAAVTTLHPTFGKRMGSDECVQGSFWSRASIRVV